MKMVRLWVALSIGLGLALILLWLLGAGSVPGALAASLVVNTNDDELNGDGDCSLREAIQAFNDAAVVDACAAGDGNDTITLGAGEYTLTLVGSGEDGNATGDLDITGSGALTIAGAGPELTIINANGIDRALDIRSGVGTSVVISGVKITNGSVAGVGGVGGGINNSAADLTLINTTIYSNVASSDAGGLLVANGNVTLVGVQVISNTAVGYSGGGIHVSRGRVTLSGCQIISNAAGQRGGGVMVSQLEGVLTITNESTIAFNHADEVGGGGLFMMNGRAALVGGRIVSNTAPLGGGVTVWEPAAAFTLTSGTIAYNSAEADGGGIYVEWGSAALSGGQILSNTAGSDGGGVYVRLGSASATLSGSDILSNSAAYGGGLGVNLGHVTLSGGQIRGNLATYDGGGVSLWSIGSFTQTEGTVTQNTAGRDGGGLHLRYGSTLLNGGQVSGNVAVRDGGGVYVRSPSFVVLGGGQILNNAAGGNGGGVYNASLITQTQAVAIGAGYYQAGGTFAGGSHPIMLYGAFDLPSSGVFTATSDVMTVSGDFSRSGGTFAHNGGVLHFDSGGAQNLSAGVSTVFNDLTVAAGTTLIEIVAADNATLNGTLTNDGTIRKAKSGLGTGSTAFGLTGAAINVSTLGSLSSLQVDRVGSAHPQENSSGGGADMLDTYYALTPNIGANGTFVAELCLSYTEAELDAALAVSDEGNLRLCRWTGSGWDCLVRSSGSSTANNTVCASGVDSFSDWTMGEVGPTAVVLRDLTAHFSGDGDGLVLSLILGALTAISGALLPRTRRL